MATRTVKPTKGQRVVFVLMVIFTIPFSLVYLALWRGRCAYCGRRIFFNRRVCKKCNTRSHEIVDNFDEKIEMFYQQMGVIDDITDIISQYEYVINQFQGINDIYEALDEEVDTKSMEEKTLINLHRTLEDWIQNRHYQFSVNEAYRNETITEIKDLQQEKPYFKDILQPYLEEIQEIKTA